MDVQNSDTSSKMELSSSNFAFYNLNEGNLFYLNRDMNHTSPTNRRETFPRFPRSI